MATASDAARVKVWDPFVRIGHWVVVAAFFVAYFTEDEALSIHVWAGYTVGALVLARIVWGFVGPRHARFADFVCSPMQSVRYLFGLLRGHAARYVGHSPAGGAMVILLLVSLVATVGSGLTVYAYDRGAGPLAPLVTTAAERAPGALAPGANERARAEGGAATRSEAFEAREAFWEETHELFANLTLLLVALHVAGVLLASFVHRENLARSMVTGYKRP